MNDTWVFSTFCCIVALGAFAEAIPRAKLAIEFSGFRNGVHGIAPWLSFSAPLRIFERITTNDLMSRKRTHYV